MFLGNVTRKVRAIKGGMDIILKSDKGGKIKLLDFLLDKKNTTIITLARYIAILKIVIVVAFILCVIAVIIISL